MKDNWHSIRGASQHFSCLDFFLSSLGYSLKSALPNTAANMVKRACTHLTITSQWQWMVPGSLPVMKVFRNLRCWWSGTVKLVSCTSFLITYDYHDIKKASYGWSGSWKKSVISVCQVLARIHGSMIASSDTVTILKDDPVIRLQNLTELPTWYR